MSVNRERWVLVGAGAVPLLILAVLLFLPRLQTALAPVPLRALVAVEVEGSGVARTGKTELAGGSSFRLHAVLQARTGAGETIYFTEAPGLELEGRPVPDSALRRWDGKLQVKVLWFTCEPSRSWREVTSTEGLSALEWVDELHPDWPRSWSVPGALTSPREERRDDAPGAGRSFGTQRFHARVELFREDQPLVPVSRFKTSGAAELRSAEDLVTTVISTLDGPLAPASRVFGQALVVLPPEPDGELAQALLDLSRRDLAFSRPAVLREVLAAAGIGSEELQWRDVELGASGLLWGEGVREGDLLRVGSRLVHLYRDEGEAGVLDRGDLCLDFERGAAVRRLEEVFEGDGIVELAPLPRAD